MVFVRRGVTRGENLRVERRKNFTFDSCKKSSRKEGGVIAWAVERKWSFG